MNDEVAVSARFQPAGAQDPAGRDVTFQVFRKSELSPRPGGYTTGTPYLRVGEEVLQTDAQGVARFTYTGQVLANDIVLACLAYGDSCLNGAETTLMVDDRRRADEPAERRRGRAAARSSGSSAPIRTSGSRCGTARRSRAGTTPAPARSSA